MADPGAVGAALAQLKAASGMTHRQLAAAIGASGPEYVRKVIAGVKPGRNLAQAVEQLATRGRVVVPPKRRETASGTLARVRARETPEGVRSRVPEAARAPAHVRGQFGVGPTTFTHGGAGRMVTVETPRSPRSLGRAQAGEAILDQVAAAAGRSHYGHGRHVSFRVEFADGRVVELGAKGGYRASSVKARMRAEGDNPLGWIAEDLIARGYAPEDHGGIVAVTVITLPN
jgi:hypothetical protein